MIKKFEIILFALCTTAVACDRKDVSIITSLTYGGKYEAERTYYTKSKSWVYYDNVHKRTLTFKSGDTLIIMDDGKITAIMYKLDFYRWFGKPKSANAVYEGVDAKYAWKTIRISLNEVA